MGLKINLIKLKYSLKDTLSYKLCQNLSWIYNQTKDKTKALIQLLEQGLFITKIYCTILTIEVQTIPQNLLRQK